MYGVKKIRILLGNSILFLILSFNKVTPGVIFQKFGKYEDNSLGDNILAKIDVSVKINILAKVNIPTSANLLAGFVLNGVHFNILKIILSFKVANTYFITGDKVNSLLTIKIIK